jgi:hypothetical protein
MSHRANDRDESQAQPEVLAKSDRFNNSLAEEPGLPPVVARMVVEIRSDGSRTVARGAMEDLATGESVALRADGSTPLALVSALAKSLVKTPLFARQAVRALLKPRRR